jgi:hypothetical protein
VTLFVPRELLLSCEDMSMKLEKQILSHETKAIPMVMAQKMKMLRKTFARHREL